jgi:hypothetical protein
LLQSPSAVVTMSALSKTTCSGCAFISDACVALVHGIPSQYPVSCSRAMYAADSRHHAYHSMCHAVEYDLWHGSKPYSASKMFNCAGSLLRRPVAKVLLHGYRTGL